MLDESAIEAMIARQRQVMNQRHEPAPSVRTVKTDEFEVYERPAEPERSPATAPAPAPAAPVEEFEVFERTPPTPAPTPEPAPAPAEAEPAREPAPAPPQPIPYPTNPSPAPTEQARPFAPQPTRRPEVWPPLGARNAGSSVSAPATAAAPAAPEPDVSRRSHAPAAPAREPPAPQPTAHAFPDLSGTGGTGGEVPRLAIVQALFNEEITGDMLGLARQKADKLGAPVVQHVTVPGVYDLPLTVQALLRRDDVDAVVVLGCVVTGETRHDEVITHATAKSLQEVSLATGKPVGFGVIGPGMTWKQAEARVVNGKHAVEAAVAQWRVLRGLTA